MSTITCPRCGSVNPAGASFCAKCAGRLTILTQSGPIASGEAPMVSHEPRTNDFAIRSGIQQTETGLWLLIVGVLLASEFFSNGIGTTLMIIGFILVTLGRNPFGENHSRLAFRATLIFFAGLVIGIANYVEALSSPFFPGSVNQYQIGGVITVAVIGIAVVMLTYSLQKFIGRILLWAGYIGSLAVNTFLFFFFGTGTVFPAIFFSSVYFPSRIGYFLAFYELLSFAPAAPIAVALYLVWRRINKGKIPK